jgi:hypothetical protein
MFEGYCLTSLLIEERPQVLPNRVVSIIPFFAFSIHGYDYNVLAAEVKVTTLASMIDLRKLRHPSCLFGARFFFRFEHTDCQGISWQKHPSVSVQPEFQQRSTAGHFDHL